MTPRIKIIPDLCAASSSEYFSVLSLLNLLAALPLSPALSVLASAIPDSPGFLLPLTVPSWSPSLPLSALLSRYM